MTNSTTQNVKTPLVSGLDFFGLKNFDLTTLIVESEALKTNPLGDPDVRRNAVLIPKNVSRETPVVMQLSGFTGNGPNSFNVRAFEQSLPLSLDQAVTEGRAPRAIFVFVEAMTFWGGGQFIDSEAQGKYATYCGVEIPNAIRAAVPMASKDPAYWCVTGGSSGGYGALQLATLYPETFGCFAAIAPDCFFEASLINEIRTSLPIVEKIGGLKAVRDELSSGKLQKRKEWHTILNAVAMGLCYAGTRDGKVNWPIDTKTGEVIPHVWKEWLKHDPIEFLSQRTTALQKLSRGFLDCGTRDQFHLQYGSRQIAKILNRSGLDMTVTEFDGTHFEIGDRRPEVWNWLTTGWR